MTHKGKQYIATLVEGASHLCPGTPFKEILNFVACGGVPLTFDLLIDLSRIKRALDWYQKHPVKRRLRRVLDSLEFRFVKHL